MGTYYIGNSFSYKVEKEKIFESKIIIQDINGFLSNYGINIISPFLIHKKDGEYFVLSSILEYSSKLDTIDIKYNYAKKYEYDYRKFKLEEIKDIILENRNELIEIFENSIIVMEENDE